MVGFERERLPKLLMSLQNKENIEIANQAIKAILAGYKQ